MTEYLHIFVTRATEDREEATIEGFKIICKGAVKRRYAMLLTEAQRAQWNKHFSQLCHEARENQNDEAKLIDIEAEFDTIIKNNGIKAVKHDFSEGENFVWFNEPLCVVSQIRESAKPEETEKIAFCDNILNRFH